MQFLIYKHLGNVNDKCLKLVLYDCFDGNAVIIRSLF